jgi:ABC-type antimicrobial peptide transport system permease subunit
LQLLVIIVASGVFLFGVVTVVSVLKDSTDRKRATIGIMRVMGVSRMGIFLMIFARAAIIGVMAALLSVGFGFAMAWALGLTPETHSYLAWKPQVSIHLNPIDFGLIVLGAIFCCLIGAIMPAWVASRLDPFDAIIEGRFR